MESHFCFSTHRTFEIDIEDIIKVMKIDDIIDCTLLKLPFVDGDKQKKQMHEMQFTFMKRLAEKKQNWKEM